MASAASARARHNVLLRYRPADDPVVIEARRELRAAQLAEHIAKVVAQAPPLTNDQRNRLALLLRGGASA